MDDEQWWQENTGLRPLSMRNMTGALDMLPGIPITSHQKTRASDALDDSVHGVTNVWSNATVQEIRDLMHSPNFLCYHSSGESSDCYFYDSSFRLLVSPAIRLDAFIKTYGDPMCWGRKKGN